MANSPVWVFSDWNNVLKNSMQLNTDFSYCHMAQESVHISFEPDL